MIKINNSFYLTCALAMSIGIFFVAGQPSVSTALNGSGLHWIAHIATYGFLAACYAKGLPGAPVLLVAGLSAGIGGLHELYEVGRYGIDFEFHDLFYDSAGSFPCALLVRHVWVLPATREG